MHDVARLNVNDKKTVFIPPRVEKKRWEEEEVRVVLQLQFIIKSITCMRKMCNISAKLLRRSRQSAAVHTHVWDWDCCATFFAYIMNSCDLDQNISSRLELTLNYLFTRCVWLSEAVKIQFSLLIWWCHRDKHSRSRAHIWMDTTEYERSAQH